MKHFPLLYRLASEDRYLIWISNDQDSVLVDPAGFVPSFGSVTDLREYAAAKDFRLQEEEPILHDLEWVADWTKAPSNQIDCPKALAAWNLFDDVAKSVPEKGAAFMQLDAQPIIYNKVFWGNNLPAVTPESSHYTPVWSAKEIALVTDLLSAGLHLFESCIYVWDRQRVR